MNRFGIVAFAVLSVLVAPACAQQRTSNSNAPGLLRRWPLIGVWQSVLARSVVTHDLTCAMFTGYHNPNAGKWYVWGIRQDSKSVGIEIADSNPSMVAGPTIGVIIDSLPVGKYPITNRLASGGMNFVIADLSKNDAEKILRLVRLGGSLKFITHTATYSASLWGVRVSMMHLRTCVAEMTQLNAFQEPVGQ